MSSPKQVWEYRTLIANLAQRDLKSRYKRTLLGWLWSLINPAVTLGLYTVVFGIILRGVAPSLGNGDAGIFALYLFCALVAWNFFAGTINSAIGSFSGAGGLLTRTYFPPESPLIAGLITVTIQMVLETLILVAVMLFIGNYGWTYLLVFPIMILLAAFSFGLGQILALGNIRYRDVNYLTGVVLQVLFYATPIVYSIDIVPDPYQQILRLNPLTHFTDAMRHAFYTLDMPTTTNWIVMVCSAVISLVFGWWIFSVNAPKVIEEL